MVSKLVNVQRHFDSCGPIAIANILKLTGYKVSEKEVRDYCLGYGGYREFRPGLHRSKMGKTLKELGIPFTKRNNVKYKDISNYLNKGKTLVLLYSWKRGERRGAHYVVVFGETKKYWYMANNGAGLSMRFPKNKFARDVRYTAQYKKGLEAWVI